MNHTHNRNVCIRAEVLYIGPTDLRSINILKIYMFGLLAHAPSCTFFQTNFRNLFYAQAVGGELW